MSIKICEHKISKLLIIIQVLFSLSICMYIIQNNYVQGMAMLITEFVSSIICCIFAILSIKVCISNKYFKIAILNTFLLIYFLVRLICGIFFVIYN